MFVLTPGSPLTLPLSPTIGGEDGVRGRPLSTPFRDDSYLRFHPDFRHARLGSLPKRQVRFKPAVCLQQFVL